LLRIGGNLQILPIIKQIGLWGPQSRHARLLLTRRSNLAGIQVVVADVELLRGETAHKVDLLRALQPYFIVVLCAPPLIIAVVVAASHGIDHRSFRGRLR
jgi:hypothetical protein